MKERAKNWLSIICAIAVLILLFVMISNNLTNYEIKKNFVTVTVERCEEMERIATERYAFFQKGKFETGTLFTTETIFKIIFVVEGKDYYVIREEPYKPGQTILVEQKLICNGETILEREYQ